jgi:O-antigen/teichoic acid export membrane protein
MKLANFITRNTIAQSINMACQFFALVAIARIFGAEKAGIFFSYLNYLAGVILLLGISLESGLIFYFTHAEKNARFFTKLATIWALCAGLVAGCIALLFFSNGVNPTKGFAALNTFLFVSGVLLFTYYNALASSLKQFLYGNVISIVASVVIILLAIKTKNNLFVFAHFYFVIIFLQGVAMLICLLLLNKNNYVANTTKATPLYLLLRYAGMALLCNLGYWLLYRADYVFIEHFINDKYLLGNYIQAAKVGQVAVTIPAFIGSSLFIFKSLNKQGAERASVFKIMCLTAAIALFVCVPFLIFGKELFVLLFGATFIEAPNYFIYLVPGILFLAAMSPISGYFAAANKQIHNFIAAILGFAIMATLNFMFLKQQGVVFAAISSSVGYFTAFVYSLIIFVRYVKKG